MAQNTVTTNQKPRQTRRWVISLIVLVGLLIRVWASWQLPVDFDEPIYLEAGYQYAQLIQQGDLNGIIDYGGNPEHPPLVKILYGITILTMGKGVVWDQALLLSRMVSVIFGTLAVLVLALFDPLAGGLLAVQTLVVKYTSQAYLEALPLLMSLLAILLLKQSRLKKDKWFLLSAIALGVAGAGKYSYFPIIFVLLYIMIWEKHIKLGDMLLYFFISGVVFFGLNPYLWHDPFNRLLASVSFHTQYTQGAHVQEVGYPWYQPFLWISRSNGFIWHPDVFFYFGFDGLIFLFALPGLWLNWKSNRWVPTWTISSMLVLLLWPTKWPQYTLVVLPALCLAASTAVRFTYEKLREQELYWEWFHNMFPRPSKRYIIIGSVLLGIIIIGAVASMAVTAINRIGWTSMTTSNSGLPNDKVNDIQALPDGRMLIGTDGGAAIWKAASRDEVMDEWQIFNPGNSPMPDQHVLAVGRDRQGTLWFGTAAGLASFDSTNWDVYHADEIGLNNDQINTLVVDGLNNIWIGTQEGAAEFNGTVWKSFTKDTSGLVDNAVFSIAVQNGSGDQLIWFGTLSGVSNLDTNTGEWQTFTRQDIELGWGGVSDLFFDSNGRLWVCTEGAGIRIWESNKWTSLRVSNSKLPYSTIEAIDELETGIFWIAASIPNNAGGVLAKYDDITWHVYREGLTGYSGGETVTIAKDYTGRYWFGTRTDGIDLYKPRR
jgi:sugar lactone lactonase YvrE